MLATASPLLHRSKTRTFNEELWGQCQLLVPQARWEPFKLPYLIGKVLLAEPVGKVPVYLVDGALLNRVHDIGFVQGGNSVEDPKMPNPGKTKYFLVLDDRHCRHDLCFVLLHEAVELEVMVIEKLSYEEAHDTVANPAEQHARLRGFDLLQDRKLLRIGP